uniref:Cytochrome b5 reductase 4 n=1 Tax=Branchiostoma floridae TaxID=7739 RepID=C3YHI6_BRAFL|eukprot:XP_002603962.1 hypothetical protein BRAFLDRAFT_71750 [Branchiostoma floridae]
MDWIRLSKSKDLSGTGGRLQNVTPEELAKHDKEGNVWTAIRGKVYNVTAYAEYHPGGAEELMRAAGKDGTDLFNEVHRWVNYESMLESCLVGRLQEASSKNDAMDNPVVPMATKESLRYDWFQSDKHVTVVVYTKRKGLTRENVILDRSGRELKLCLILGQMQYRVHVELEGEVSDEVNVTFGASGAKVDIKLAKVEAGRKWSKLGSPLGMDGRLVSTEDCVRNYRACVVESRVEVTHDTALFCVRLPPGTRIWVPAGHHVYVRGEVSGVGQVERPYTPVPSSLTPELLDPRVQQGVALYLMIKVYPQGALTPVLAELQPGDHLDISDYDATLALPPLVDVTSVAFLVAGTGFTPVPGLVMQLLSQEVRKVDVTVFFFNKQEEDILWREQLTELEQRHNERLKVIHVLSDPGREWGGRTGRIRREVVENGLPAPGPVTMVMVCGPIPFNQSAVKVLQEIGYQENMYYVF